MSDSWTESGQAGKSRACTLGAHGDCAHFVTVGGGFNPQRLRLEFGAGLCPCACHSPCPVATRGKQVTVPTEVWRESCTCPGAEHARHRSHARKEAFESTRSRAAGKSRDEIRDIYVAELHARGLAAPGEDLLEAVVNQITGNPPPTVRLAVESLAQLGRELRGLSRLFRPGQLSEPVRPGIT